MAMMKKFANLKKAHFIWLAAIFAAFSINIRAQKPDAAAAVVKQFYQFHFARESSFSEKAIAARRRFFTPKLRRLFDAELKRQKTYSKKHPTDKPFFDDLSFQPIEFCPNDYRIGTAREQRQTATVEVNFIYSKSSCEANDGTPLTYRITLSKIGDRWLIDDVIYDDGTTLTGAFETASRIK